MLRKRTLAAAATLLAATSHAEAGAYCPQERLTSLIVQGDVIFFTTDKSCPGWCQVDQSWSVEGKKRAYATLLAAKISDRTVSFYWNELTSNCSGAVPTNAAPGLLMMD